MSFEPRSPSRSRGVARISLLSLMLAGCGESPAPAPAPAPVAQEFDDPFAEEESKAVPGDSSQTGVKADAEPVAAGSAGEVVAPVVAAGGSAGEVVGPAAEGGAGEVVGPAAGGGAGEVVGPAAGESAVVADDRRPAKKSAPAKPGTPVPVPEDRPVPAPVPEPVPAAAPAPVPAPVEKPAPEVPPQQRFAGTFRYAGGEAQKQGIDQAIEGIVNELNALIRGIARKRLREGNPVREQITIAVDGDRVSTTFGPGRTVTGKLGGPAVASTSDSGKPVQVSISMVKGRLVQTFTAEDGGRRSVYTLDETGDRLILSVTISSERLPNPLKYALTYRRT